MAGSEQSGFAVRGLHVQVQSRGAMDRLVAFVRDVLPREGVNVLVAGIGYDYAFQSYPQVAGRAALKQEDLQALVSACQAAGVELVPQMNCLGHQSWGGPSGGLLRAFPEFDETPWIPQDAGRDQIYCRSYCPNHPKVHEVLFALIDEVAEVCGASRFHVGMDEVFLLAEAKCPRCAGQDRGKLFAQEATLLHDHLAEKGLGMWMWGDRLIKTQDFNAGIWEASANGTWPAVDMVPKDIVVCDWHYEHVYHTPEYFISKGLGVLACPWRQKEVALAEMDIMRAAAKQSKRALGMLQTTWCGYEPFIRAYHGELAAGEERNRTAIEGAECFRTLFAALQGE